MVPSLTFRLSMLVQAVFPNHARAYSLLNNENQDDFPGTNIVTGRNIAKWDGACSGVFSEVSSVTRYKWHTVQTTHPPNL